MSKINIIIENFLYAKDMYRMLLNEQKEKFCKNYNKKIFVIKFGTKHII